MPPGLAPAPPKPKPPAPPKPAGLGTQENVNPQWIYQQFIAQGLSPVAAAQLTAIAGRESNYSSFGESGYRPGTGDYFSTGLFQENLGANFGPNGALAGLSGTPDIHGTQVQNLLGGSAYQDLYGNALNDVKAAAALYKQGGINPWKGQGGTWVSGISPAYLEAAVKASGGKVTMQQLLAGTGMDANALTAGAALNYKQNAPGAAQAKADLLMNNQAMAQLKQWIDEQSNQANLEAGYQRQGILLSEADLQSQQAALLREEGLAQYQQGLTEKQYGLQEQQYNQQFADMLRNYQTNTLGMRASQAGAGSWFTRGAATDRTNLQKDYLSSKATLTRQRQGFELNRKGEEASYREQIKQMQDQQAALARMAQRYGISMQEVDSRLKAQLSNIQYGGLTSSYPLVQQGLADIGTIVAATAGGPQQP